MAILVNSDGRTIARTTQSRPARLTHKQILARRNEGWLKGLESGQSAWLIARLARVSERSVWRGIASARELREDLSSCEDL